MLGRHLATMPRSSPLVFLLLQTDGNMKATGGAIKENVGAALGMDQMQVRFVATLCDLGLLLTVQASGYTIVIGVPALQAPLSTYLLYSRTQAVSHLQLPQQLPRLPCIHWKVAVYITSLIP